MLLARLFAGLLLSWVTLIPYAQSHFQTLIPTTDLVTQPGDGIIDLELVFTHPMEQGPAMSMGMPERFGVLGPKGHQDLFSSLKPVLVDDASAFRASYKMGRPGNYQFYVEPAPYWEPAEGKMIIHYTKVIVDAYDYHQGWEELVGFPVEIEPLNRPYGLWTGNLFQGIVRQGGEPVPFAEVEVEWLNDGSVEAPADAYVTQVIRADNNGVFSYVMPKAGWWGFAALLEADKPMDNPEGEPVPVELGALIWVKARDMAEASTSPKGQ